MDIKDIEAFRKKIRELHRVVDTLFKLSTDRCNLTMAQMHVILEIGLATMTISQLAGILEVDRSNLSRTVDGLVKNKLIKREIKTDDRRYMAISLTDAGKKMYRKINNLCNRIYSDIFKEIPGDKHAPLYDNLVLFLDTLETFNKRLAEKTQ